MCYVGQGEDGVVASKRTGFADGCLGKHGAGKFYYHHFIRLDGHAHTELTN